LERIANESEKDHWPIIEVLTAYVRENAPWPPKPSKDTPPQQDNPSLKGDPAAAQGQPPAKLATDIQAVLTMLGRRDRTYETGRRPWLIGVPDVQPLDLRGTDLRNAHLTNAHLEGADLSGAHLEGARLGGVNLKGAYLRAAHLEGVDLALAHLEKAILEEAHLEKTTLQLASLEGASLRGANLERANLKGARNLTVEQLSTVRTLYQAHIDPPLLEQLQQQYPHLLEKSQD
jgi:Pentapeptide repeats (8 copies)